MCGIFSYSGPKNATELIINGLKRLEYRGYDSWGVALIVKNEIKVIKKVGAIGDLKSLDKLPTSHLGIGHTRWATHGGVTTNNAHPHYSTDKSFVVAQNGIVENYQDLKKQLQKQGYKFTTQTDTEIIVRLIEHFIHKGKKLLEATKSTFKKLEGRNTIVVLSRIDNQLIAIRNGSPLIVGLGQDEIILASDTLSFADITSKVVFINDFEMVNYEHSKLEFWDIIKNKRIEKKTTLLSDKQTLIEKKGFDSFYFKEVMEQPQTLKNAALDSYQEFLPFLKKIKAAKQIYTLGAGSASFAAGAGAYIIRKNNKLNVIELKAYEINSYVKLFNKNDVLIAVSQSGETADTLEAINSAKKRGVIIASIVNMVGSTLSRQSDFAFLSRSGPEISVVSTKAFTSQLTWFLMLSSYLKKEGVAFKKIITKTSQLISLYKEKKYLESVKNLARILSKQNNVYILGRDELFYIAQEAAMKIKEISYIHAEAFSAGELKHGVISLITKNTPVIGFVPSSNPETMINSLAQVKARGANVIGVSAKKNELFDFWLQTHELPSTQIISSIIPIQILGYYLAKLKNLSPDKPRNLAKSVTVN